MDNKRRVTLADLDRLDGGSYERMVQEIRKTTSDEKEVEELTTLSILGNFSERLKNDKKEESSSHVSPSKEVESNQDSTSEGQETDGRKQLRAANSEEKKDGKKIKIRWRNNGNDNKNEFAELGLDPPPDLPASLREVVARKGGTDITLVMMKEVQYFDKYAQESTISLGALQFKEPNFLTEEEKRILDLENGVINVTLIQPCHEEISLGMKKLHRSSCYLLNGRWRSVTSNKKNGLEENDIVQLWSFRYSGNLGLVLVKVWPSQSEK